MKDTLEILDELIAEVRTHKQPSTFVSGLLLALLTAQDNATWELERQEKEAAAARQAAGSDAAAPPPATS